jgi:hypothetical protein
MARGTAGVESAGGAKQATAARPKALEPGAYGKVAWHFFEVSSTGSVGR